MSECYSRRGFLARGLATAGGLVASRALARQVSEDAGQSRPAQRPDATGAGQETNMKKFEISLAAWSVHRMFYAGKLKQIEMPELCRKEFGIGGLELVNSFFPSPQYTYCRDLAKRAADQDVKILLIMVDGEGDMAHPEKAVRKQAVRNHRKWLDIAQVLGCHSIRCNSGEAKPGDSDAIARCADSFADLCALARPDKLNVLIENHWGLSSDPESLLAVIKKVNDPLLGTLPDFGNFPPEVDRYDAVRQMMPYAKAVSAKCYDFGPDGEDSKTDYGKMMKVVLDAGYHGFVGIEYEGKNDDEIAGVKACQKLLARFQ